MTLRFRQRTGRAMAPHARAMNGKQTGIMNQNAETPAVYAVNATVNGNECRHDQSGTIAKIAHAKSIAGTPPPLIASNMKLWL
jgi:hypothetical protein